MGQLEEIRNAPVDEYGWHVMPDGRHIKLGNYVTLGNYVKLGNYVTLGDDVTLGNDVVLGNSVVLGNYVELGNYVKLGNYVTLGDSVVLGNYVKLGDGVVLKHTPTYIVGEQYSMCFVSPGIIQSGCITKPIKWWKENIRRCAEEHHYTPEQIEVYENYVNMLAREDEIRRKYAEQRKESNK